MKKIAGIFVLAYYSLGILFLPLSDFSIIPNLSAYYTHCKLTEHRDMQIADFITDHLLSVDAFFDNHDNGDEQKPHRPLHYKVHLPITLLKAMPFYSFAINQTIYPSKQNPLITNTYKFNYTNAVFRPPIV